MLISHSNPNVNFTPFFNEKKVLLFTAKSTRNVFVTALEFTFLLSKSKRVNKCKIGNLLDNLPEQPGEPCPPSPPTENHIRGPVTTVKNNGIICRKP